MTWLIKDQVLLVSEHGRALRIVNLEDGVVSTICKRTCFQDFYLIGKSFIKIFMLGEGMSTRYNTAFV